MFEALIFIVASWVIWLFVRKQYRFGVVWFYASSRRAARETKNALVLHASPPRANARRSARSLRPIFVRAPPAFRP